MTTEALLLPREPQLTLAHVVPTIERMRRREESEEEAWAIGGGALLAARFRHRGAELLTLHTTAAWPAGEDAEGRDGTLSGELRALDVIAGAANGPDRCDRRSEQSRSPRSATSRPTGPSERYA